MQCPRCQQGNPPHARFCLGCGARLALTCVKCGTELPGGARFCLQCGQPISPEPAAQLRFTSPESYTPKHLAEKILTSKSALEGERKQVTVLFADLKGSMELLADRDPEEARKLLDPVLERMMEAVHRYEGTVNQVMGDGIMALFGAPVAHEDHGVRACYAALDMQAAIRRYADEVWRTHGIKPQIRVGLNSGEVVVRAIGSDLHMDYTAVGQTTHLAARMEQLATPGTVLLTTDTLRLAEGYVTVKPLGPVPLKGLEAAIEVYELTGAGPLRSRLHAAAARGLTRFVGREGELEQLRQALGRASGGHGQVVAIVGEPGVGKSRLVWEVTHSHRVHGWLVLQAGSVSYGKATSYLPVVDLLKNYFAIEDRDGPRAVREKVTGKLLTLDRALESSLPALLSLLDVPTGEPPAARSGILVVLSAHGEADPVAGGHGYGGRPDLDVQLDNLSRRQRLLLVVGVIRPVRGTELPIELAVRCPEPALTDRGVGIDGTLEDHLLPVRGEDAKHDEDVRVRRRGRHEQLGCRRSGDLRFSAERGRQEGDAVAHGVVPDASPGGDRRPAEAAIGRIEGELSPLGAGDGPFVLHALDKAVEAANLELNARLILPAVGGPFQEVIEEALLEEPPVGAQDKAVVHLDRHVPIDPHPAPCFRPFLSSWEGTLGGTSRQVAEHDQASSANAVPMRSWRRRLGTAFGH